MEDVKFESPLIEHFYSVVINDTIENLPNAFLSENTELETLIELKQLWSLKVQAALGTGKKLSTFSTHPAPPEFVSVPASILSPFDPNQPSTSTYIKQEPEEPKNTEEVDVKPTHIPIVLKIMAAQPFEISVVVPQAHIRSNKLGILLNSSLLSHLENLSPIDAANTLQAYIDGADCKMFCQFDGNYDDDDTQDESSSENSDADLSDPNEDLSAEPDPDSNDDMTDEEDEQDTDNLILCKFMQVKRQKNHWKFFFQHGIMIINGAEFVFHKATGEAIW